MDKRKEIVIEIPLIDEDSQQIDKMNDLEKTLTDIVIPQDLAYWVEPLLREKGKYSIIILTENLDSTMDAIYPELKKFSKSREINVFFRKITEEKTMRADIQL